MRQGAARITPPAHVALTASAAPEWCTHAAAGPGGTGDLAVDLSRAHATVREFGLDSAYAPADAALVPALSTAGALTSAGVADALAAYAAPLADACAVAADPRALGSGRVDMVGRVAIVTPGATAPPIPPSAQIAVVDLRGLPAVEHLGDALAATVAPLLTSPVDRAARWQRAHVGPVDEVFLAANVYATFVNLDEQPPIAATGARDMPLVLLTDDHMAPAAVELAGNLRLAGRASVLGSDVLSAVGELTWRGVADSGVLVRTRVLDRLFHPVPPQLLRAQRVQQDTPADPTTASYKRDIVVDRPDTQLLRVTVDAHPGVDLDMFLMYDGNGDGSFSFPNELISYSATPSGDERIDLLGQPPLGRYQIWVHGFAVPGPHGTRFDLGIDVASGALWPDVIPADQAPSGASLTDIARDAQVVTRRRLAAVNGSFGRSFPAPVFPYGEVRPPVTGKPEMRAALVIAHGVTRLFFPYFDVVGDGIDGRLDETLASVETWDGADRLSAFNILRRFGEVLHDGHQFIFNFGPPTVVGLIPLRVEDVGGRPVVRRSGHAEIHPGDSITAIDGRPIEEIYAEEFRRTSAATPGYRFDIASRYVLRMTGPEVLTLMDTGGATRTVSVDPVPAAASGAVNDPGTTDRPSGPLTDLGAAALYYLNLNAFTSSDSASVNAALDEASQLGSRAIVVDMRGYPGADHFEVAARLIPYVFFSPLFITQLQLGPDARSTFDAGGAVFPLNNPSYAGPIALLVGPHTVSAAENFSQMLVGAGRTAVVIGAQSAGTNGNITGVQLPGGFGFTYTGVQTLNPDGSRFHGIGIAPDVTVPLTAADLRDGVDRDLLAAVSALKG